MSAPVGHCEFCGDLVYGPHAETMPPAHPCCADWVGRLGHDRCWSCVMARRGARLGQPLNIPPDPPRAATDLLAA